MMRRLVALALFGLLGAAGCEDDRDAQIQQICAHVCECQTGLPSLARICVDGCVEEVAGFNPPPGCTDCLLAETCDGLFSDACQPVCN